MHVLESILFFVLLFFVWSISSHAQDFIPARSQTEASCATPILKDPALLKEAWENTRRAYPGIDAAVAQFRLQKGMQTPVVGQQELFWVYNFARTQMDTVRAELRAIGTMSYLWVAVDEWANGHVTMTEVNAFLAALETATPSTSQDSTKGILTLDRQFYGEPPNVNSNFEKGKGDGKTHFLVCDIQDGWTGSGGFVAGFFFEVDVDPNTGLVQNSNRRDMLYIDSYPTIFFGGNRRTHVALPTLAHEFQHLIHWNYDPDEVSFFNEGLSEYAEFISGFPLRTPDGYFTNTNIRLTGWSNQLEDYSRAAIWTRFLAEQYGLSFLKTFTQTRTNGIPGFEAALGQVGIASDFATTARNFFTANWVGSNTQVDPTHHYKAPLGYQPSLAAEHLDPNLSNSGNLREQAAQYIRFSAAAKDFAITFTLPQGLSARAIEVGDFATRVRSVASGVPFTSPEFGSTYTSIVFVVMNTNIVSSGTFSYAASGEPIRFLVEEKYDDGTPDPFEQGFAPYIGFGNNSATRGVAVRFEPAVRGNTLRKVRLFVAFNQEFSNGTALANDNKDFIFHVWGDSSGRPGKDIIPPLLVRVDRAKYPLGSFVDVDLSSQSKLLTKLEGPIYVGYMEDDDDYVGTYVAVDKSTMMDYSYIYRGPNHPRAPNKWETFREVSALNNNVLDGFNVMFRAVFEYGDSSSAPKLTIGYLQNPLLSEYIDVVVASNDELRATSVSGYFSQTSGSTMLKLLAIPNTSKAFIDTSQQLNGSGQISIRVRAPKRYGVFYTDTTVTMYARLLNKEEPATVTAPSGEVTVSIKKGSINTPTYLTIFDGVSDPGWQNISAKTFRKLFSIGPFGTEFDRTAVVRVKAPVSEEPFTLALYRNGSWLEVSSVYDRTTSTVVSTTNKLGLFALMKRNDVDGQLETVPAEFALYQNYPNPFNPSTTIQYDLPHAAHVRLVVYDLLGKEVAVLVDEEKQPGRFSITLNADRFSTGVYFYRITAGVFSEVKKLMVLK